MKSKIFSLFKYNRFTFGKQVVSQFVVFECKWLFSIIFFYFHKCDDSQDRFHTHAFNAFSIKIFGKYLEYVLLDETTGEYETTWRTQFFKYFQRNLFHKIGNSTGCLTLLFSGPWKKTWKEYVDGQIVELTWGRDGL